MKALVVDDSTVMRKIVTGALAKMGCTDVVQASDGKKAVVAAMTEDVDVVLMDWNMPNMSGLDALRAIRAAGNKTPVIMVTTEAERSRVIEAIKAGANNYIVKPFKPDTLATKVQETLAKCGAS
jgi:two-component system chemotaxis response regulator CheY